jgi:hypothetical protein
LVISERVRMLDKLDFEDTDYSVVMKHTASEPMEVGDLPRR